MSIRWKNADGDTKWAFSAAEQEAEMMRDEARSEKRLDFTLLGTY